jgi:hypothetical protein
VSAFGIQTASACTHAPPKGIAQQRAIGAPYLPYGAAPTAVESHAALLHDPISREFISLRRLGFRFLFRPDLFFTSSCNILVWGWSAGVGEQQCRSWPSAPRASRPRSGPGPRAEDGEFAAPRARLQGAAHACSSARGLGARRDSRVCCLWRPPTTPRKPAPAESSMHPLCGTGMHGTRESRGCRRQDAG